jgi:hypothetical protein
VVAWRKRWIDATINRKLTGLVVRVIIMHLIFTWSADDNDNFLISLSCSNDELSIKTFSKTSSTKVKSPENSPQYNTNTSQGLVHREVVAVCKCCIGRLQGDKAALSGPWLASRVA